MRILIIGSLAAELGMAAQMAIGRGAKLHQVDDVDAALAHLRVNAAFDVVLCDIAYDFSALTRRASAERISVPIVVCGVNVHPDRAAQAIRDGARDYLPLPPDAELIAAILDNASHTAHALLAKDPAMCAIVARAEQVARSDASLLILGESGTGKEILARHIHRKSHRAGGPFVALNCAAIPENLLESELFGHEKGAFSGAIARRVGKFEAAAGGTLLLDEISEMDIRLQAKLLRAIQEKEIDRLGGHEPVKLNVRILATSNRNLGLEASEGRFREDLYFRLNVVSLKIPPLRERPADVAMLASLFARRYADLNGLPFRSLSQSALDCLSRMRWRGNVRELENALHRAVLLATGNCIEAVDIESCTEGDSQVMHQEITPPHVAASAGQAYLGRTIHDVERDLIINTLMHTAGNRTHAAVILGLSIRALRNKLRDYAGQGVAVPPPGAAAMA